MSLSMLPRRRGNKTILGATLASGTALFSLCSNGFAAPPALSVSGNHLQNSSGQSVRLKGVNIMGYEYTPGGDHVTSSVVPALNWGAQIIRLPINQDYWMGYGVNAATYRAAIDNVVNTVSSWNRYVVIDLHWSDAGQWGKNNGQHNMPDDNTSTAWNDIANHYKNNPAVLFGVYNEPHDISWSLWRDGGTVTNDMNTSGQRTNINYHTPGIESLIYTIRNTGASNVIVAGGIGYSGTLTGVVNWGPSGYRLWDPGPYANQSSPNQNIMYDIHIYPFSSSDWDGNATVAANAGLCVYVGEFGGRMSDGVGWDNNMISWLNNHNYNATAWCFYGSGSTSGDNLDLCSNWNFDPTWWHGVPVKNWLSGSTGQSIANGTYKIASRNNSNMYLEAYYANTADGTIIDQYTYNGGNTQKWNVTYLGNNQYSIINVNANKPLDVAGSGGSGTFTELWTNYSANNQKWVITPTDSGWYRVSPAYNTNLALDVYGAYTGVYTGTNNNGRIDVYTWSGAYNQQWAFWTP